MEKRIEAEGIKECNWGGERIEVLVRRDSKKIVQTGRKKETSGRREKGRVRI